MEVRDNWLDSEKMTPREKEKVASLSGTAKLVQTKHRFTIRVNKNWQDRKGETENQNKDSNYRYSLKLKKNDPANLENF